LASKERTAEPTSEGIDPVGLGRPIMVFRREAAAEQAGSASDAAGKVIRAIPPGVISWACMQAFQRPAHA
jgi:hypothetical protein